MYCACACRPNNVADTSVRVCVRVCSTIISNTASANANEDDNNAANNMDVAGLQVCPLLAPDADLALTKTASVDTVVAGNLVVFTLRVTNNGPSDAMNVTIEDNEIGLWNGFTGMVQPDGCVETTWNGACAW